MANLSGFIKLHRKLIEWGWYSDCVVKDVFLHILMTATWREGQEYMGYKLRPGDAIIGRKKLALELGFSEQQIRTALKKLESTKEIVLKSTNRFTIATVVNWAIYQGDENNDNQRITNNQPTDNQRITNNQPHLKKVRIKEGKNIRNSLTTITLSPPSAEDVRAYVGDRGYVNTDPDLFVAFYKSKNWMVGKNQMTDWKAAVDAWEISHREKPHGTYSQPPRNEFAEMLEKGEI